MMITFTSEIKNEISATPLNELENRNLLLGYLYVNGEIKNNKVTISLENIAVARKIFKTLKYSYKLNITMTVRMQKKFKMKKVFIFEMHDDKHIIEDELKNIDISDKESVESFIKGVFLASGSISDPKKSGYHLEIILNESKAPYILDILQTQGYNFKMIPKNTNLMLYLKSSEEISDFLKMLGATNALFYYEDIRIYRDHKNMVNRLNNCEQANLEKTLKSGDNQTMIINYLIDHDYMSLIDEKTKQVAMYRIKYPEESYQNLANIISKEIDKKVTKSYINHHFRKINEIYDRILQTENKK